MERTLLIVSLSLVVLFAPTTAGAKDKVWRIGFLGGSTPTQAAHLLQAFKDGLRDRGYVEGQNAVIEARFADGRLDRLPALAAELVGQKVDVIFAPPVPAAVAAKKATTTIPIVFALVADPVGTGLVRALARPGGNVTGMSTINVELGAKRLEILREAFPRVRRVAVLHHPEDSTNALQLKETERAARALRVELVPVAIKTPEDIEPAFAALTRARADALFVMENPTNFTHRNSIVALADRQRLPAMYALREFVDAGGLMSYSVNLAEQVRGATNYVDKILKGARPGDLPVEQPTRIDLILNLKTAEAQGFKIPQSLLLRADRVIR